MLWSKWKSWRPVEGKGVSVVFSWALSMREWWKLRTKQQSATFLMVFAAHAHSRKTIEMKATSGVCAVSIYLLCVRKLRAAKFLLFRSRTNKPSKIKMLKTWHRTAVSPSQRCCCAQNVPSNECENVASNDSNIMPHTWNEWHYSVYIGFIPILRSDFNRLDVILPIATLEPIGTSNAK